MVHSDRWEALPPRALWSARNSSAVRGMAPGAAGERVARALGREVPAGHSSGERSAALPPWRSGAQGTPRRSGTGAAHLLISDTVVVIVVIAGVPNAVLVEVFLP